MSAPIFKIVDVLNNLLRDTISPHEISFEFDKIFEVLQEFKLKIEIQFTQSYYLDEELNEVLIKKLSPTITFHEAADLRQVELQLLKEKANEPTATLKTEPSYFEYRAPNIIGFLNHTKANEKLLAQLIKDYQANN
jgi:hypothetical protein